MIIVDDPAFAFFIGLCLLRRLRTDILRAEPELIPEITSRVVLKHEDDVDRITEEALLAYKSTPRYLCRALRLCCVSFIELGPSRTSLNDRMTSLVKCKNLAKDSNDAISKKAQKGTTKPPEKSAIEEDSDGSSKNHEVDHLMAAQSVRSCTMLSAVELVHSLLPFSLNNEIELSSAGADGLNLATDELSHDGDDHRILSVQQYVVIDIRPSDESIDSGAGTLPRAIQMEPLFLDRPDALRVWLEHFEGTRGCHICIVDMPPAMLPGVALWRRLLLGEGVSMMVG
jgi:hypothetical protein